MRSGQATALGVAPTYGAHAASLLPAGGYSSDLDTSDAEDGLAGGTISGGKGSAGDAPPGAATHRVRAHTLFAWRDPVSPHIAVSTEGARLLSAEATYTRLMHVYVGCSTRGATYECMPRLSLLACSYSRVTVREICKSCSV